MNTIMLLINALLAAAICLRLILFRREGGTHRPLASLLAYVLTVASGALAISILLLLVLPAAVPGTGHLVMACMNYAQPILNLVLCLAIFAMRGNVVELFRRSDDITDNPVTRWLRKDKWI